MLEKNKENVENCQNEKLKKQKNIKKNLQIEKIF